MVRLFPAPLPLSSPLEDRAQVSSYSSFDPRPGTLPGRWQEPLSAGSPSFLLLPPPPSSSIPSRPQALHFLSLFLRGGGPRTSALGKKPVLSQFVRGPGSDATKEWRGGILPGAGTTLGREESGGRGTEAVGATGICPLNGNDAIFSRSRAKGDPLQAAHALQLHSRVWC